MLPHCRKMTGSIRARVVAAEMPMTTIDEVVLRDNIPRIDFIKMDIEGSELSGGTTTLPRCFGILVFPLPPELRLFPFPALIGFLVSVFPFFLL